MTNVSLIAVPGSITKIDPALPFDMPLVLHNEGTLQGIASGERSAIMRNGNLWRIKGCNILQALESDGRYGITRMFAPEGGLTQTTANRELDAVTELNERLYEEQIIPPYAPARRFDYEKVFTTLPAVTGLGTVGAIFGKVLPLPVNVALLGIAAYRFFKGQSVYSVAGASVDNLRLHDGLSASVFSVKGDTRLSTLLKIDGKESIPFEEDIFYKLGTYAGAAKRINDESHLLSGQASHMQNVVFYPSGRHILGGFVDYENPISMRWRLQQYADIEFKNLEAQMPGRLREGFVAGYQHPDCRDPPTRKEVRDVLGEATYDNLFLLPE